MIEQLSEDDPTRRQLAERLLNAPRNFEEAANDPMSAMGQKRTSHDTLSNVRYWGQSGHWKVAGAESRPECPLSGVKRTFASYLLDVCL